MHSISIGQHCFRSVPPAWVSEWRTDGQRVSRLHRMALAPIALPERRALAGFKEEGERSERLQGVEPRLD